LFLSKWNGKFLSKWNGKLARSRLVIEKERIHLDYLPWPACFKVPSKVITCFKVPSKVINRKKKFQKD